LLAERGCHGAADDEHVGVAVADDKQVEVPAGLTL